jgi:uncharacterized phage protein gp47/JayE
VAFDRPTITELKARVASTFAAEITDANGRPLGSLPPRGTLRAIANTLAGLAHENNGFVADVELQTFPDTADSEHLERIASQRGISRKPSAPAVGVVAVTGTVGVLVPAGTAFQRADGQRFTSDVDVTLASSPQDVDVTAATAGVVGNTDAAASLVLTSPIAGLDVTATVVADGEGRGLSGGVDVESDARLLQRLRKVEQTPPQGGSVADYENWTLEVAGVTRVWVRPQWDGAGSVGVAFVLDDDPTSIIPDGGKVAEVQAYLTDPTRAPPTANVFVFAPTPLSVDVSVTLTPNTAATRGAVTQSLDDLFARAADLGNPLYLSQILEAVETSAGVVNSVVTVPSADVAPLAYEIPVPGTFTFS